MLRRPYLLTLSLATFLTAFHFYANSNSLYFTYKWLDIPMHLIGGFIIGLLCLSFIMFADKKPAALVVWFAVIMLTLLIGSLWEIYELFKSVVYDTPYAGNTDLLDTFSDLINDGIGAVLALLVASKKKWYA